MPAHATNVGPVLVGRPARGPSPAGSAWTSSCVDVGDDAVARAGDEVVLFGPGDDGEPTAEDWAEAAGTINYEIVTRVGPRVPRVYVGGAA